jgi:asparagine synthase (glutamine-hydrolysing)
MCGIAGIVKPQVLEGDLKKFINSLKHRGPDDSGYWISYDNKVGLVHTRLSILDLSDRAKQPMHSLCDRYLIVFNGEIYNYIELRNELIAIGYSFETDSDTEVILAGYNEYGIRLLDMLNGMWAFAIFDKQSDTLFLSRDRYGIKPLYYYKSDNEFLFASEVQAIHKYHGPEYPLNELVIRDILKGGFSNHGSSQTYLKDVKNLPSGHYLVMKNSEIDVCQWYFCKKQKIRLSVKEQAVKLQSLIFDSVRLRLRSDVPVGTCLSGGVDSTAIASVIKRITSQNDGESNLFSYKSFTLSFPNTSMDEVEDAKWLSQNLGNSIKIVSLEKPDIKELEYCMSKMDGPMHSLAFYPIWKLFGFIHENKIKVTLDGQGPDEMLGGYRPVFDALRTASKFFDPLWFLDILDTYQNQGEKVNDSSKTYVKKELQYFLNYKKNKAIIDFKLLLLWILRNARIINKKKVTVLPGLISTISVPEFINNPLDENLFKQFFQSPLPGILNQFDRCSMAHGVEARMPFMDYRIVEFIFSLPPKSKIGNGYTKRILRLAMKDIVPDHIRLKKNKIGFNAPMLEWFKGDLKNWLISISETQEFNSSEYFDPIQIKEKLYYFLNDKDPKWEMAWNLWPYFHFAWWLRHLKSSWEFESNCK